MQMRRSFFSWVMAGALAVLAVGLPAGDARSQGIENYADSRSVNPDNIMRDPLDAPSDPDYTSAVRSRTANDATRNPNDATKSPNDATRDPNDATKNPNSALRSPNNAAKYPNDATRYPNSL